MPMLKAFGVIFSTIVGGIIALLFLIYGLSRGSGISTCIGLVIIFLACVGAYSDWPRFPRALPAPPPAPKPKPPNRPIADLD